MLIFSLDTKKCMNALLLHPAFDSFLFIEGDITTFNTFQFNGRLKDVPVREAVQYSVLT